MHLEELADKPEEGIEIEILEIESDETLEDLSQVAAKVSEMAEAELEYRRKRSEGFRDEG